MAREWTVMVYLAGDNNLSAECLWAIKEMKRLNFDAKGKVAITALFDPGQGIPPQIYTTTKGDSTATAEISVVSKGDNDGELLREANRLEIKRANRPSTLLRDIDTGSPKPLVDFICGSIKDYPAVYYMVVLAGHGSGANGDFLSDRGSSDSLSIPRLGDAFETVRKKIKKKIDIVGMDSCLMSMAEVAHQLRHTVKILVGAEGFESNAGWPYQRVLKPLTLARNSPMQPIELARTIVKKYIEYYSDYALAGLSVDLSACDLGQCDTLRTEVGQLSYLLEKALKLEFGKPGPHPITDAVLLAHWEAQSYNFDQFTDLYDFCDLLSLRCKGPIRTACNRVKDVIEIMIQPSASSYSGPAFQHSHGLSIFFPWAGKVSTAYKNLDFTTTPKKNANQDRPWHAFLDVYLKSTRREPRRQLKFGAGLQESVGNKLFNPSPADSAEPSVIQLALPIRTNPKYGTRGPSFELGSMKNPPLVWAPDVDKREAAVILEQPVRIVTRTEIK